MKEARRPLGLVLGLTLVGLLGSRVFSEPDPKDVKFVDELIQNASGDPEVAKALAGHMANYHADVKTIVRRRLPTPANVQQYSGSSAEAMPTHTLASAMMDAHNTLEQMGMIVDKARANAKDVPRKYVADKGGKIAGDLDDVYNDMSETVQKEVNTIRGEIDEMVAIALVINAASGGGGAKTTAGADTAKAANGGSFRNPDGPTIGVNAVRQAEPEVYLSDRGDALFEDAKKRLEKLPDMLAAKAKALEAVEGQANDLVAWEKKYNKGMKGAGGGEGTGKLFKDAVGSVGAYLVAVNNADQRLVAFVNGDGQAIKSVVRCARALLEAGRGLQADIPESQQNALAREALDSNQDAARRVTRMAGAYKDLLAYLASTTPLGSVRKPGGADSSAPAAGESKGGEGDKARKKAVQGVEQIQKL